MNTTDEQFRVDLARALDESARHVAPLDLEGILDAGARRVRHQRFAVAAGGVAAVTVLGLGGWALLPRDYGAVPAAPTPIQTTPVTTAASVSLDLPGGLATPLTSGNRYTVTLTTGPDAAIQYAVRDDAGITHTLGRTPIGELGRRSTLNWFGGTVVLGIVPDDAVAVSLLEDGNTGGNTWDGPKRLAGTGYSAIAFRLDRAPAQSDDLVPMWWRADGTPVSNSEVGQVISFPGTQGRTDVWALRDSDRFGLRTPDGGSATSWSAGGPVRVAGFGTHTEDAVRGVVSADFSRAYLVPGRVSRLQGSYAPVLAGRALQTAYWPDLDMTVAFAEAHLPEQKGTSQSVPMEPLTELTWVNSDGTPERWQPPR